MMNITPLISELDNILQGAERPEKNLYQRYSELTTEGRNSFVIALIGKIIEQNNRLKSCNTQQ
ncbi:hypothetical protein ACSMDK_15250 [Yersinia enterocolitica]|uniref:hypothetical protein n=1 Tax=Yersinia TaxID=629 RepID=UPI003AB34876